MTFFNNQEYLEFLKSWKDERKYEPFCEDGLLVVNGEWEKSSRIMFLLKETYGDFYQIHDKGPFITEKSNKNASNRFWRNMRMYTYILDELINGRKPEFKIANEIKEEENDCAAYVNIKKLVENNKVSDDKIIADFAKKDKELLKKQIELISPKIIFCSGTFGFCNLIFENIQSIVHNLSKYNDIFLLGYYHLSYYGVGFEEEFNDIIKIIGNYIKKSKIVA